MSEWKIILSPKFKIEFNDIRDYISNNLLAPNTAASFCKQVFDKIESLKQMPKRCPLVDKEPWFTRGLRKLIIDNYIVFYYPNEKTMEILIFHIFYKGRNIDELLPTDIP